MFEVVYSTNTVPIMHRMYYLFIFAIFGLHEVIGHERCRASPYSFNPGAKVRFTVIMSIRQSSGSQVCGDISESALLSVSAIDWAVDKINQANYIPMMTLGKLSMTLNTRWRHWQNIIERTCTLISDLVHCFLKKKKE